MSVRQIARVLELPPNLSAGQRVLLVALADCADHQGDRVFPGLRHLMVKSGLSRRYLQIALHKLIDAGYVEVVRRGGRGQGQRTIYRLHLGATQPKLPLDVMGDQKDRPNATPKNGVRAISDVRLGDLLITSEAPSATASPTTDDGSGTGSFSDPSNDPSSTTKNTGASAPALLDRPKQPEEVNDAQARTHLVSPAVSGGDGAARDRPDAAGGPSRVESSREGSRAPIGVRDADGRHRRAGTRRERVCPHETTCATYSACIARSIEEGRRAAGVVGAPDGAQQICAERTGLGRPGTPATAADRSDDAPHERHAVVALDPVEGARLEALTHIRSLRSRL